MWESDGLSRAGSFDDDPCFDELGSGSGFHRDDGFFLESGSLTPNSLKNSSVRIMLSWGVGFG
jgi:hypothetical protein